MNRDILIQFVEDGCAENPFPPYRWPFVPRVGDDVRMPETQRIYRVVGVEWSWVRAAAGQAAADELRAVVRLRE